jgi:hypothetical protein
LGCVTQFKIKGLFILFFTRESLQSYAGIHLVVVAVVAVGCLLILYSIKQFENLPLHHERMQFDILSLQQGSSAPKRACSLVSCHFK